MTTKIKILSYISKNKRVSPAQIQAEFGISKQMVFRHLAKLQQDNKITKKGSAPKVFYEPVLISRDESIQYSQISSSSTNKIIDKNFLYVTPLGEVLTGISGFKFWCERTEQPLKKTADEYIKTLQKYSKFKENKLINATQKLQETFHQKNLNKVFYADFYSIERFGKTKLGQLILYAKQSQNQNFINQIIALIQPEIDFLIKKYKIDAIAFIPPSVKRNIQIMSEFEKKLNYNLRKIKLSKISNEIIVPQKTLSKLADRIENADKTIFIPPQAPCQNLLLIDDAVGSGATLNETAKQLKQNGFVKGKIIGFTPVGSFKGFDVISEI